MPTEPRSAPTSTSKRTSLRSSWAPSALRAEDYSDFGSNVSGKVAARYDFTESFALRGSAQTGFRAPSLQQQYFATTSTNFIAGIPYDITSFPVSDPIARALGAQDLDAEEAVNYSLGAVMRFADVTLTIDAYSIDIDDRIVLSENLTQDNVRAVPREPGLHRYRRRALLHQRRRHRDARRRRRAHVGVRYGQGRPIRHDDRGEPQRDGRHTRAGDGAARRAEPAAAAVRASQRADLRRGQARTASSPRR